MSVAPGGLRGPRTNFGSTAYNPPDPAVLVSKLETICKTIAATAPAQIRPYLVADLERGLNEALTQVIEMPKNYPENAEQMQLFGKIWTALEPLAGRDGLVNEFLLDAGSKIPDKIVWRRNNQIQNVLDVILARLDPQSTTYEAGSKFSAEDLWNLKTSAGLAMNLAKRLLSLNPQKEKCEWAENMLQNVVETVQGFAGLVRDLNIDPDSYTMKQTLAWLVEITKSDSYPDFGEEVLKGMLGPELSAIAFPEIHEF